MFSYKHCEIFKKFFYRTPLVVASSLKDFFETCMLYCWISSGLCRCSLLTYPLNIVGGRMNRIILIRFQEFLCYEISEELTIVAGFFSTFSINLQLISGTCFFFLFLKNKIKNNQKIYIYILIRVYSFFTNKITNNTPIDFL